jgi:hypothetical protein
VAGTRDRLLGAWPELEAEVVIVSSDAIDGPACTHPLQGMDPLRIALRVHFAGSLFARLLMDLSRLESDRVMEEEIFAT